MQKPSYRLLCNVKMELCLCKRCPKRTIDAISRQTPMASDYKKSKMRIAVMTDLGNDPYV